MPDENGICRCGGTGEDGCTPANAAQPSPQDELAAQLIEAVRSLPGPVFEEAVEAAIAAPRRLPALGQPPRRAELPAPTPMQAVFDAIRGERDALNTRRSRRDE
jgi:hypothetical protein